jgi:hypothetical protein
MSILVKGNIINQNYVGFSSNFMLKTERKLTARVKLG